MPAGPAGGREREILTAIVETFISTGEPVGSRTLARASREGLSAATIRNVMADLADGGYLEQPHTSAGGGAPRLALPLFLGGVYGQGRVVPAGRRLAHGSPR